VHTDKSRGITGAPTSWDEMLARDESLAEMRELPPGHGAWRAAPGEPWQTVGSLAELRHLQQSQCDGRTWWCGC